MKKIIFVLVFMMLCCGCGNLADKKDADTIQQAQTKASLAEAQREIGMPAIKNFQERKLAKMIFELRDQEDFICHAYLVNTMTGEVGQYLGKCLGYGLPYSVQFTNPEKVVHECRMNGGSFGTLPQADPNGLFMPSGLSATWIMLYDHKAEEFRPVYVEPQIIVSPFILHDVLGHNLNAELMQSIADDSRFIK
jgi:hypothetical protein